MTLSDPDVQISKVSFRSSRVTQGHKLRSKVKKCETLTILKYLEIISENDASDKSLEQNLLFT